MHIKHINGSVLKNPEISGALYTLRIQYKYTQIQCEDGARDFRVLEYTPVTSWIDEITCLDYLNE